MNQFSREQQLRDLYYDPKTGYMSAEKLYQKSIENDLKVSRKQVKDWLKTQDTFTRFKRVVKRHKTLKTYVNHLADQIQLDLVDMSKLKNKNKNYCWILTGVEILSRFGFAFPVTKKDTKNMTKAVKLLLEEFKDRFKKYPKVVQFDEGKEFYNVGVKTLLESHKIKYFSTLSEKKAAIVERFNRTLKSIMWKYFYSKGTYHWLDILDDLVYNYNHKRHGTILMKPADVNKNNEDQVWLTLYGSWTGEYPLPKYKIGDQVRVSKYKTIFEKGYEANFTEEIFKISKIFRGDPTTYEIKDTEDEPILGKFYEQELSPVDKKDHTYRVEKILKTKGDKVLVKWLGYDSQHNSWIKKNEIRKLKETNK